MPSAGPGRRAPVRRCWNRLHEELGVSIRTAEAQRAYRLLRRNWAALTDFEQPEALVAFLTAREGDSHVKDAVLAGLVTLVQMRAESGFFTALLWLGVWPGLDGVYRRCLRRLRVSPAEVVSATAASFLGLVTRVNLSSVQRVAATLVLGTERDVLKALSKERGAELHGVLAASGSGEPQLDLPTPSVSLVLSFESEVEELRAWLRPLVGEDTELLVSVLLYEEGYVEVGTSLGLAPAAVRKRVQRALGRLRKMKKKMPGKFRCPKSLRESAFSSGEI
nr:sigma-70 family RNA polymerase sigma factor [Myxococcus xanthus]